MTTEAVDRARFDLIRYAQCWEDADVLLRGLAIQPGDRCLSIASAGDNALAMLTADPSVVYAVDLSRAQLACVQLRIAMYRSLEHEEFLRLIGSRSATPEERHLLYQQCRGELDEQSRAFWDARPNEIAAGIGEAGKFERYFRLFRRWVLPLVHRRGVVNELFRYRDPEDRARFYDQRFDTPRWRLMFRVFFSRVVMGRLGRDPAFFRYVEGSIADRILERARYALAVLDPSENPYLRWILTGSHHDSLPVALRREHFETVRDRCDRIVCEERSVESFLADVDRPPIDRYNLSDIFEYMSENNTSAIFDRIVDRSAASARVLYWNMLAPRRSPDRLSDRLLRLDDESDTLHRADRAFFYSKLIVEQVR
ncbi:MAG: DUF3419 family protein [Planctomycetota bacterium]